MISPGVFQSAALILAGIVTGCGGGSPTIDIRRSASERPDIDARMVSTGEVRVPAAHPFNITHVESSQQGKARGESESIGDAGARCAARIEAKGEAFGWFQLGYMFDNTSGQALEAIVKASVTIKEEALLGERPLKAPNSLVASRTLSFFIKDSNGHILKNENLLSASRESGRAKSHNRHDLVFKVRFEPDVGYYLVFAGRVDARCEVEHETNVALEVNDGSLVIDWKPIEQTAVRNAETNDSAVPVASINEREP